MEWVRPTLRAINDRIQTNLATSLDLKLPLQKPSIIFALSQAISATNHLLYGNLDWVKKNMLPDSADSIALEWWAKLFGIERKRATCAVVSIKLTGVPGSVIKKETPMRRQGGGPIFNSEAEGIIDSKGEVVISCLCSTEGLASTPRAGDFFELVNPIAGVNSSRLELVAIKIPGVDAESDDSLFKRFRDRIRNRGQGGNAYDYIAWAQTIPGVGRVWPFESENRPGFVDIFAISNDPNAPILTDDQKQKIQRKIDKERPVGVRAVVWVMNDLKIHFQIKLVNPDQSVHAKVEGALKDYFLKVSDPKSLIKVETLKDLILRTINANTFEMNEPKKDIQLEFAQFAIFGGVTWT